MLLCREDTWCTCRSRKALRATTRRRGELEGTGRGRSASCSSAGEACAIVVAIGFVVSAAAFVAGVQWSRVYNVVGQDLLVFEICLSCFIVHNFSVLFPSRGQMLLLSFRDLTTCVPTSLEHDGRGQCLSQAEGTQVLCWRACLCFCLDAAHLSSPILLVVASDEERCVCSCARPDVSKMKNLVMGFGRKRARKAAGASKTRQLDMLEKMRDYCEEEGVCRRCSAHILSCERVNLFYVGK